MLQNEDMRDAIRLRVREERKRHGWDTATAAKFFGLTESGYKAREAGRGSFPAEDLCRLADEFGLSLNYLITGNTETVGYTVEEVNVIRMLRTLSDYEKRNFIADITHAHLDATKG